MLSEKLKKEIASYPDFPKKGIYFRDINPVLSNSELLHELIQEMSKLSTFHEADGIVAIDARGFIFGSLIAYKLNKSLILARKRNKLPGEIIEMGYQLEYGDDSLSIQKSALNDLHKFVIVDDLLATGGTAKCVSDLLTSQKKEVLSLVVVIELIELKGRNNFSFPVYSQLKYD